LGTPRPHFGDVLYGGAGIHNCTVPGTVAITFDDGPYKYTSYLLDLLKKRNVTATFFLTNVARGKPEFDNESASYADVVRRMHAEGHQLGSHTWSHEALSNLTQEERGQEIVKNEMAFRNLMGFFPTYMRPPYGDCTSKSNCTKQLSELGYHLVIAHLLAQWRLTGMFPANV
jgi:peptidoglycan/xylan/chitin deacetylase (PgdA/CDA1 family)